MTITLSNSDFAYERERSIAQHRQPNDFYVETKLDTANLKDSIISGEFELVLLMGTPGSGKSEFLHALERDIRMAQKSDKFIIKHDATHVDAKKASAVTELKKLLTPFRNDKMKITAQKVGKSFKELGSLLKESKESSKKIYVIGVNRGIMNRVFADDQFSALKGLCHTSSSSHKRIILIDLSKRDYTVGSSRSDSILTKLILKIFSEDNWEKSACLRCSVREDCPIIFNIRYLRENCEDNPLIYYLQLLHIRKQCILTFRDLLAIISYVAAGHKNYYSKYKSPCDGIRTMIAGRYWQRLSSLYLWNTSASDIYLFGKISKELQVENYRKPRTFGRAPERFFGREGLLSQFDPKNFRTRLFDEYAEEIYTDPEHAINTITDNLTTIERNLFKQLFLKLQELNDSKGVSNEEKTEQNELVSLITTEYLKRRKLYIDFKDISDEDKSNYQSLALYKSFLTDLYGSKKRMREIIKESIIMSDRLEYESHLPKFLVSKGLEYSDVYLQLFHDKFNVSLDIEEMTFGTGKYVECGTSKAIQIIFRMCENELSPLELTLDMFEVLFRIKYGYDPHYVGQYSTALIDFIKNSLIKRVSYYDDLKVVLKKTDSKEKIEFIYDSDQEKFYLRGT